MQLVHRLREAERFFLRVSFGADLLEDLTQFCAARNIRLAQFSGLGAVRRARIAYYDQSQKRYYERAFSEPMEIVSLIGNVSIKDGKPFVHAHIVLATGDGRTYGGHLCKGTEVFAAECFIETFHANDLVREPDAQTGLNLWTSETSDRM